LAATGKADAGNDTAEESRATASGESKTSYK